MRRSRLTAAALAATTGLVLGGPVAAGAAGGPARTGRTTATTDRPTVAPAALDVLRTRCDGALDARTAALGAASAALATAKGVTGDHRTALDGLLTKDTADLQALKDKLAADTDAATLKADCRSIFGDYRVFALVLPRTRLVAAADRTGAAADHLAGVATTLDAAVAKAGAAGRDTSRAQADLAAMRARIDAGRNGAAGVAAQVLGLTPADWNADHDVLRPSRQALRQARLDLGAARDLGRTVVKDLRGDHPDPPHFRRHSTENGRPAGED